MRIKSPSYLTYYKSITSKDVAFRDYTVLLKQFFQLAGIGSIPEIPNKYFDGHF